MDTNCRKRLRLQEIAVLHGSGSRKAAEAVAWFSETAHIALGLFKNMHMPPRVVVKKDRSVHAYAELWHASACVLRVGVEQKEGSSWQFLSSAVLTAFTFEAYLNHVGPRTIKCWSDLDRLSPWAKLELLCETLGVSFPAGKGARPLQTVVKLLDFRNSIAHGRSVELGGKPEERDADDRLDAFLGMRLQTEWEKLIQTKEFAERARVDVEAVLTHLHSGRKDAKEILFNFGVSHHRATAAKEP